MHDVYTEKSEEKQKAELKKKPKENKVSVLYFSGCNFCVVFFVLYFSCCIILYKLNECLIN